MYEMQHLKTADLVGQRSALSIQRIFIRLTGSHTIAVFLSECFYWQQRAIERGESEFYMSLEPVGNGPSWADYELTRSHVDGARSLLEPVGILTSRWECRNGKRTTLYSLDLEKLDEAIGRLKSTGERLQRTFSIDGWRTWRRTSKGQHPAKADHRVTMPRIRAAAVTRKRPEPAPAPTTPPMPAPSAPQAKRSAVQFEFPIDPDVWFGMDDIQRAIAREQAKPQNPNCYWIDAVILGYGDVIAPDCDRTPQGRRKFAKAAIAHVLPHLKSTSKGDAAGRGDAIDWIVAACRALGDRDRRQMDMGVARLDKLISAIAEQSKQSERSPSNATQALKAIVDLDKLTDEQISRLSEDVLPFDDHERWCADWRLDMVKSREFRPRQVGESRRSEDFDLYRIVQPQPKSPQPVAAAPARSESIEEFFAGVR